MAVSMMKNVLGSRTGFAPAKQATQQRQVQVRPLSGAKS
jgi:hypothetical protein